MGLALCLGVGSQRQILCITPVVRPPSRLLLANTSGMEFNFIVILSFQSFESRESVKSKVSLLEWVVGLIVVHSAIQLGLMAPDSLQLLTWIMVEGGVEWRVLLLYDLVELYCLLSHFSAEWGDNPLGRLE